MKDPIDLNIIHGQIDAFFGDGQDSPGVKTREQYRGKNYDSYLRGVRQVEDKRKAQLSERA